MGCVQLGQNSFVCSKHFSQFGICKMLDALLHSSWCELCALLAEGSQLSIWINTLSLSLWKQCNAGPVTALFLQIDESVTIFSGTVVRSD